MTEPVEIPNRVAFKASEVCELAQIPPYVLKSWEKEFPGLGVVAKPGGPRVYRRADVEQVLRIKHLLFAEGLTLAGARRRLEGEAPAEEEPLLPELGAPVAEEVREKVAKLKQEMRSLLDFLAQPGSSAAASGPVPPRPWGQAVAPTTDAPATAGTTVVDPVDSADGGVVEAQSDAAKAGRRGRAPAKKTATGK